MIHGTPFAVVHGGNLRAADVTRFLLLRGERTFVQDPAFGFRQLVDVAIRALSPAVNDPTTGVQSIDRLSDLLVVTGRRPDPTGLRVDSDGHVRVKRQLRNFEALLVLSMTEIMRYGPDAQVVRRLRAVLNELELTLPVERHPVLARQRDLLEAAVASGAASAVPAGSGHRRPARPRLIPFPQWVSAVSFPSSHADPSAVICLLADFAAWSRAQSHAQLPAEPATASACLIWLARHQPQVSTTSRRLSSIAYAHTFTGVATLVDDPHVSVV